jgi:hypothetical protein
MVTAIGIGLEWHGGHLAGVVDGGSTPPIWDCSARFAARRGLGGSNLDQLPAKFRSPNGEWSSSLPSPRRSAQLIRATRCYKGNESEYTVDPTTPIFANATGDRSFLVPGAAIFVIASKNDDGKLTSTRLYVEKDGIKPPM